MTNAVPEITLTKEDAVKQINDFSKRNGLYFAKCYISPDVAKELLTLEKSNRKRKLGAVKTYAGYMSKGKWKLNPDPIKFDSDSHLIDGGHRLSAVIESKMPSPFIICCGTSPETRKVMDQGVPRTVIDILSIEGYQNRITPLHAAVLTSMMLESPASLKITIPKLEAAELLKQYFGVINDVIEIFGTRKGVRCSSVVSPVVRAYLLYKNNPQMTRRLKRFVGIMNGTIYELNADENAAHRLREWLLISLGSGKTRPLKRVIYRKTEKALWLFLHKEPCELLTEVKKECFPLPMSKSLIPYFDNTREFKKEHGGKRLTRKT